jgi:predicted DsbA family dithiol-disulfide isomerase
MLSFTLEIVCTDCCMFARRVDGVCLSCKWEAEIHAAWMAEQEAERAAEQAEWDAEWESERSFREKWERKDCRMDLDTGEDVGTMHNDEIPF